MLLVAIEIHSASTVRVANAHFCDGLGILHAYFDGIAKVGINKLGLVLREGGNARVERYLFGKVDFASAVLL